MSIFYIKVLVTFYLVQFYKFRQDTERINAWLTHLELFIENYIFCLIPEAACWED
jgi:hypothetical protein